MYFIFIFHIFYSKSTNWSHNVVKLHACWWIFAHWISTTIFSSPVSIVRWLQTVLMVCDIWENVCVTARSWLARFFFFSDVLQQQQKNSKASKFNKSEFICVNWPKAKVIVTRIAPFMSHVLSPSVDWLFEWIDFIWSVCCLFVWESLFSGCFRIAIE